MTNANKNFQFFWTLLWALSKENGCRWRQTTGSQKSLIRSISNNIFSSLQRGGAGEPWKATFTEKFGMFEIPRWTWTISSRMRSQEVMIQTLECFSVTYLPLNLRWLSFKTNWVKKNGHVLIDVLNIVCNIIWQYFWYHRLLSPLTATT